MEMGKLLATVHDVAMCAPWEKCLRDFKIYEHGIEVGPVQMNNAQLSRFTLNSNVSRSEETRMRRIIKAVHGKTLEQLAESKKL